MAIQEFRVILWRVNGEETPGVVGAIRDLTIDFAASIPATFELLNGGWTVASHSVSSIDASSDLMLSFLLVKAVTVPDSIDGLPAD